jgi:O-methyltransferase
VGSERRRGKGYAYDDFDLNSENLFRQTLIANGVQENTTVHRADVSEFNFATLPPVSFALVDVDLYRPMHAAVEGVWEVLQPGGLMVLDDCGPDEKWDGAGTAHREFCAQYGLPVEVVARKLGVVRRPARP